MVKQQAGNCCGSPHCQQLNPQPAGSPHLAQACNRFRLAAGDTMLSPSPGLGVRLCPSARPAATMSLVTALSSAMLLSPPAAFASNASLAVLDISSDCSVVRPQGSQH